MYFSDWQQLLFAVFREIPASLFPLVRHERGFTIQTVKQNKFLFLLCMFPTFGGHVCSFFLEASIDTQCSNIDFFFFQNPSAPDIHKHAYGRSRAGSLWKQEEEEGEC